MTKKIQQLSSGVVKKLRSGIAFTNVAHCVEELVLNSIDAGANCIAVHLNLPFYQIQVIDNGYGIDIQQMKMIGTRYATSKCHTLDDLQNLRSGGFRGEALASLKEVSSILMIESRAAASNKTYCKMFTQGKASDPKKSLNCRPSKGTTVSVYDFMYNLPVRKNSISEALDFEECRRLLQSIALMYPNISFTLKNEVTGKMSLQLKKCTSLYHSFLQMFDKTNASNLRNISYQKDEYEINGCISTDCHISKDLQFLYVNKRRVLRTKLHKLINSILNKALSSRQKSSFNNNLTPDSSSPSKNHSMCIFALNISCPYDKYDIIFEPRKTMIEFSDWHTVLKVVEDSLIDFLKRENLYSDANESEASMLNVDLEANFNNFNSDIQDCKQGLFSNAVHRYQQVPNDINFSNDSSVHENTDDIVEKNLGHSSLSVDSKSDEFVTNFNQKAGTSSEVSSSFIDERKTKSSDTECYTDTSISNTHLLDNLKSTTQQNIAMNNKILKKSSADFEKTELGIPCRSVFPSGSPVMLHVSVKSTLSDLQTSTSDSNFLKLKEKFQYFPKKEKINLLNNSKFDKRHEKVCLKLHNTSNLLSLKNSSLSHLHLGFNKGKSEANECSKPNLINKSSQCPSVSLQITQMEHNRNICDSEGEEGLKTTKDKSLQCPSVALDKKARIISPFTFENNPTKLSLQSLRLSNRIERKSWRKTYDKDVLAVAEDLLNNINSDDEMCIAKKFRFSPSTFSENSVTDTINTTEAPGDNVMDFEYLPHIMVSSDPKVLCNSYKAHSIDDISENMSFDATPEDFIMSKTKETKRTYLSQLECSTFNLQAFRKEKVVKNCAQNMHISTELDISHIFEKNKLLNNNTDISTLDQVNELQTSEVSIVAKDLNNIKEQENDLTSVYPDNSLKNTSGLVYSFNKNEGVEMSELNDSSENIHLQTPKENDIVMSMHLEHEASKLNSSNGATLDVCTKIVSPNLYSLNSDMSNSDYDMRKNPDVLNFKNKNIGENENIVEDIHMKSSLLIGLQSKDSLEENSSSHLCRKNLSSSLEVNSLYNINFESNPFTEQLSSDGGLLKQKSDEKSNSNECVSNCISKEHTTKPSVTELVNMDVENLDNDQKSNDTSIEVSACNSCHNLENENQEQIHNCNITEMQNSINVISVCSGMNDVILPVYSTSNILDFVEYQEKDLCGKKSEDYHNRWKLHSEPKSNRKIYVDTITGNSAYNDPGQHEVQVNQNIETSNDNSIENMLNAWDNPMFNIPFEASSITENKYLQSVSQMFSFLNSYRFSKSTLNSLQVIGQVDCKFIACILKDFNESCRDQRLLALFDQHAVHERIRLEGLIEDLYETNQNGEKSVKSIAISTPLQVQFDNEEIGLLQTYHEKLHQIGIRMNIDTESNDCSVHSVPACLVHKGTQDLRRSVSDSILILQNSVKEWLTSLLKIRSIPQVLPKTLLSVLNYQACRGAVKFGDPLSLEQCRDLLKLLSGCKLPFQCAHGRPSVAPILDLKKVEGLYKKRSPPQLQTLLTHSKK